MFHLLAEKDTQRFRNIRIGNTVIKMDLLLIISKNFKSVDLKSVDNTCCFDIPNSIMRPSFEMFNHPLLYNPYYSNNKTMW